MVANLAGALAEDSSKADSAISRPLMLYVHVPFCKSRCTFCDWVQGIATRDLLMGPAEPMRQRYVAALCREIRTRGEQLTSSGTVYVPQVVYWGGGTASSLDEREAESVMAALHDAFDLHDVREATIECSPDSVGEAKLRFFRSLGFNRMSSGVQSFVDDRLRRLGRRHTADEARQVVTDARAVGFDDVSIDIMSGFPDQDDEEVVYTTIEALKLPLSHISLYSYRPTDGTSMRTRLDRRTPDASRAATTAYLNSQQRQFAASRGMIAAAGLEEYASGYFGKVSPFAAMTFQLSADMVGFGSGAASLVDKQFLVHQKGLLHQYIDNPLTFDIYGPASNDRTMLQYLQIGLSMFDGILRDEWATATGVSLDECLARPPIAPLAEFLRRRGLVEDERGIRLRPQTAYRTLIELAFELALANRPTQPDPTTNPTTKG
jgi:coproporphyrinogen III oxidase-like Fe-S oxidoreductase